VRGEGISYHHQGFDNVQRCPIDSVSVKAWRPRRGRSPAARRRGGEQEGGKDHVLPFYRGICACAEHVRIRAVPAMRAACLDKSVLAHPRATLCTSALLQVVVAVSFQRPARDDNGNVETKPVCSGVLHVGNITAVNSHKFIHCVISLKKQSEYLQPVLVFLSRTEKKVSINNNSL